MAVSLLVVAWSVSFAGAVEVKATAERTSIRLSESLRVTLTVEDAEPPQVELPKEPLDEASSVIWRARVVGTVGTERLADGRHRWSLTYRVDPYAPGEAIPLIFAPVKVGTGPAARSIEWNPLNITVVTGVKGDVAIEARGVTSVEDPPPAPTSWLRSAWWVAVVPVVAFVAWAFWSRWRRQSPPPIPPLQSATAELDALADPSIPDHDFAERLSCTLRVFIERQSSIAATTLTTSELLRELACATTWPLDCVAELGGILRRCDEGKFAAAAFADDDRRTLLDAARRFVTWEKPAAHDSPSAA